MQKGNAQTSVMNIWCSDFHTGQEWCTRQGNALSVIPPGSRDPPHEGSNGATFRCGGANGSVKDSLRTTAGGCYPDRDFFKARGQLEWGFLTRFCFY